MSDKFEQKEKVSGVWQGNPVSFNRIWGGHRFTDDEVNALLAGKEITILGLKTKNGGTYGVKGELANLEFKGSKFVGFNRTGFVVEDKVPDKWCGHVFTEDEKIMLEQGLEVYVENAVSKKGSQFSCNVKYDIKEDGNKGIIPLY